MQEDDSRKHGYKSNDPDFSDHLNPGEEILNTSTEVTDESENQRIRRIRRIRGSIGQSDDAKALPHAHILLLPLRDFIAEASQLSRDEAEEQRGGSVWGQADTFLFVRLCKARPEFANLNYVRAVLKIPWEVTVFEDLDDAKEEFKRQWRKVLLPYGETPLSMAIKFAKEQPLHLPDIDSPKYVLLMSVCGYLQRIVGDADIFISTRDIGELLKVSPRIASAYLENMVEDGFIKITAKGTAYRATRFRFDMENFEQLKGD